MAFPRLQINALILNKLVYLNNFRDDSIGLFPVQSVESAQMRSRLIPCAKSFRVVLSSLEGLKMQSCKFHSHRYIYYSLKNNSLERNKLLKWGC